jgi:hypothetical protein
MLILAIANDSNPGVAISILGNSHSPDIEYNTDHRRHHCSTGTGIGAASQTDRNVIHRFSRSRGAQVMVRSEQSHFIYKTNSRLGER